MHNLRARTRARPREQPRKRTVLRSCATVSPAPNLGAIQSQNRTDQHTPQYRTAHPADGSQYSPLQHRIRPRDAPQRHSEHPGDSGRSDPAPENTTPPSWEPEPVSEAVSIVSRPSRTVVRGCRTRFRSLNGTPNSIPGILHRFEKTGRAQASRLETSWTTRHAIRTTQRSLPRALSAARRAAAATRHAIRAKERTLPRALSAARRAAAVTWNQPRRRRSHPSRDDGPAPLRDRPVGQESPVRDGRDSRAARRPHRRSGMAKSRDRPPSRPRTPVLPDRPPSPARKPPPSAISGPAPDAPSPLLPPPSRPTRQRQRPPGQPAPPRPAGRFLRLPAPPGAPSAVPPAGARAFPTAFSVAPRSLAARAPSPAGARMSASPVLNAPAGGVIVLRVAAWPAGSLAARTAPERWC